MSFARVRALVVVGVLVVFALVFVIVALVRDTQSGATSASCPKEWPRVDLTMDEPRDTKINVYNGTNEPGLANSVADAFRNRKFQVKKVGNEQAKKKIESAAILRYGPKTVGRAHVLQAYFLVGSTTTQFDPKRQDDVIDVVLGEGFQQLNTSTEVNQNLSDMGGPELPKGTCAAPPRKKK